MKVSSDNVLVALQTQNEANRYSFLQQYHSKSELSGFAEMVDSFEYYGYTILVLELCEISIRSYLRRRDFHGLPLRLVHHFARELIKPILILHNHSYPHGDIKPDNVFFLGVIN
jgi:serine/threonine protein kinase